MDVLVAYAIVAATFAAFGLWVAARRGHAPMVGVVLGGLFGPLGVLVLAILPGDRTHEPMPRRRPGAPARRPYTGGERLPPRRPHR